MGVGKGLGGGTARTTNPLVKGILQTMQGIFSYMSEIFQAYNAMLCSKSAGGRW